jgi:hypothetical protein
MSDTRQKLPKPRLRVAQAKYPEEKQNLFRLLAQEIKARTQKDVTI